MKEISNELGWGITGNESLNCAAYVAGKAKQKSLNKTSIPDPNDEKNGYRGCLDISTVRKNEKYPRLTNPNWCLIVVGTNMIHRPQLDLPCLLGKLLTNSR